MPKRVSLAIHVETSALLYFIVEHCATLMPVSTEGLACLYLAVHESKFAQQL